VPRVLIGRDRERARIDELLDRAREGRSGALLVHGDPGIGKTALLDAARASAEGLRVLAARGIETESEIPFAGLWDLLGPLLDMRDRLPPAQAQALGQALALEASGTPARFAVPAAVLGLLSAAAEDGPVLCLVDDVQWLDQPSVEAIVFAARRLGSEGIAMVLAARTAQTDGGREVDTLAAGLERLPLAPLAPGEATELLRRAHGDAVSGPVTADLVSAAAGNPLALVELPRALSAEQRAGREALPPVLPAGLSLDGAFRRQLDDLPAGAAPALLCAAAAGGSEDVTQLAGALDRLGAEPGALDAAEAAGVVVLDGPRVRFRHPLLRAAAYHAATPPERRAAHRALAEAAPEGAPSRAWHLAAAVTAADEEVARDLEQAANDARRRGGHASAARAFARAAELTPAPTERARRLLETAIDHVAAGALDSAEADADRALPLPADPLVRTGLERIRAHVLIRSGRPREGADAMAAVAGAVEQEIPPLAAAMLLEAALGRLLTGPATGALDLAERAKALGEGVDIITGVADVLIAQALTALGDAAGAAERLDASAALLLDAEPPPGVSEAVAAGGHAAMWAERFDHAQRILDRLVDAARGEGALARLCYPLTVRAQVAFRRGHWTAAYADAVEAARASEETAQESVLAYAVQMLAEIEAGMGRFADARANAQRALELARRTEAPVFGPYARAALGAVAAGEDEVDTAIAEYERARRDVLDIGVPAPGELFWTVELVELHARAGEGARAREELERLERLVTPGHPPVHQAQLARCRALVADGDEAASHFAEAMEHHGRSATPFERARTELAAGERLRRARSRTESRTPLRAALETFERLGARWWAERTRAELRASGATSGRGAAAVADVLSPHELQVAMIVAKGATNKEAAAALFVSPKTVEHHLGQIYRKLDLRSRTELSALLSTGAPAPARGF
jgi:DNA-binding NarL/FixJ family response regulator